MLPDLTHYAHSLTTCEAVCGDRRAYKITLHTAQTTCQACLHALAPYAMPEAALLRTVRDAAKDHGWFCYHTHRSDHSEPGWPDVALAKPGHPLYLGELKTARGKLTIEQQRWLTTLAQCTGVVAETWRPRDIPHILRLLAA